MALRSNLALVAAVLTLANCSKTPSGAKYFGPMELERRTFDITVLGPAREVKGAVIISNRGQETIAGKTYYKYVSTFDGIPGAVPQTFYQRLGEDGVYGLSSPGAAESLIFPLPPTVGRQWSSSQDGLSATVKIEAIEDFDALKKTYRQCLKVVSTGKKGNDTFESTSYYAPDVGLIFRSDRGAGISSEMKLLD